MDNKKIMILNGGYSEVPLIQCARDMGLYVIVTGNNKDAPGNQLADKYVRCNYSDKNAILELACMEDVSAVCSSCNDFAYLSAAYVCEQLGFSGYDNYDTARMLHHKDSFRDILKRLQLPCPQTWIMHKDEDAEFISHAVQYPVIIKPVDMCGGVGMTKCDSETELLEGLKLVYRHTREDTVVVEEYLEGTNHGCITFIKNRKVIFHMIDNEYHDYTRFAVSGTETPSDVQEDTVNKLMKQIETIAEAMQLCDGLLHVQFMDVKHGQPVILELCRRPPADLYIRYVQYAVGVDICRQIIKSELGEEFDDMHAVLNGFWARQVIAATAGGRLFGIEFARELEEYIYEKELYFTEGGYMEPNKVNKLGAVFLCFPSKERMQAVMRQIRNYIIYDIR